MIEVNGCSEVSVLLEERLHILHVHSVVLVGVELEGWCLELLVAKASVVQELGILLIVESEAGDLTALPREMTQIGSSVNSTQEKEAIVEQTPLRDVLELNGIGSLHHFYLNI